MAEQDEIYKKAGGEDKLSEEDNARLIEIGQMLEAANSWYQPLQDKLKAIEERQHTGRSLFAAAADATAQWSTAHQAVVIALQQRRQGAIDAQSLSQSAVQIRGLINRIREL